MSKIIAVIVTALAVLASGLALATPAQAWPTEKVPSLHRVNVTGEYREWDGWVVDLKARPGRYHRPVKNGKVIFRYRIVHRQHGHWYGFDSKGYYRKFRWTDNYKGPRKRVVVRLDSRGVGARKWGEIRSLPGGNRVPVSGVLSHSGWASYKAKAVGMVIVRNASGRVVERYPHTIRGVAW